MQLVNGLAIMIWTVIMAIILFACIRFTIGLRVDSVVENEGLDRSEHGTKAYFANQFEIEAFDQERKTQELYIVTARPKVETEKPRESITHSNPDHDVVDTF